MKTQNVPEPLYSIKYQLTEQDARLALDCFIDDMFDKIYNKRKFSRIITRIAMMIIIAAVIGIVMLDGFAKHYWLMIFAILLTAVIFGWKPVNKRLLKFANEGSIKARREAGEFNSPVEALFYEDKFTVTDSSGNGVIPWEELTSALETSDGLFLIHRKYVYFFIPARFFDKISADEMLSFIQQKLGDKFTVKSQMIPPVYAEETGVVRQTTFNEESPQFSFDFEMTGKDITRVAGYTGKIIFSVIGALFTLLCVLFAVNAAIDGNYRRAGYAAFAYVVVIAAGAFGLMKALRERGEISENVTLNWYDDHVTAITHKEEETVNRESYGNLKKIRRHKGLTAVFFKDNKFLYVPQKSAQNDAEFTEWENFLIEKLKKYSKL